MLHASESNNDLTRTSTTYLHNMMQIIRGSGFSEKVEGRRGAISSLDARMFLIQPHSTCG
jgi:hypothetical protein